MLVEDNNGLSNATLLIIQNTIEEISSSGLNEKQRLLRAQILSTEGTPDNSTVKYELVIAELCAGSCEDPVEPSTLFDDLSEFLTESFDNGTFLQVLQANANSCGGECNLGGVSVAGGLTAVVIVTATPSSKPSSLPSSSPSSVPSRGQSSPQPTPWFPGEGKPPWAGSGGRPPFAGSPPPWVSRRFFRHSRSMESSATLLGTGQTATKNNFWLGQHATTSRRLTDLAPCDFESILQRTIEDIAQSGLGPFQRVIEVIISTSVNAETIEVDYELVLEELCVNNCTEQQRTTTMYSQVTTFLNTSVKDGNFTSALQVDVGESIGSCDDFINAQAVEVTFGEEEILIIKPSPSSLPSESPTLSTRPSSHPSSKPSSLPSSQPSSHPSESSQPSSQPSSRPSSQPSVSSQPTLAPVREPSGAPSTSSMPSTQPSSLPSTQPSSEPSEDPSRAPTLKPSLSDWPTSIPSSLPSTMPSSQPSSKIDQPSSRPSSGPSTEPSSPPSSIPTRESFQPSLTPSDYPSFLPTDFPSIIASPSSLPSGLPSMSDLPSSIPSEVPSTSSVPSISVGPSLSKSTTPDFDNGEPSIEYNSTGELIAEISNPAASAASFRQLESYSHQAFVATNFTASVFQTTIKEIAELELDKSYQRVKSVVILNISGCVESSPGRKLRQGAFFNKVTTEALELSSRLMRGLEGSTSCILVDYEIVLEEKCAPISCSDRIASSGLFDSVSSAVLKAVDNGGFTARLVASAKLICGNGCAEFQNVTITGWSIDEPVVSIFTPPTVSPTPKPSRRGKTKKSKSKRSKKTRPPRPTPKPNQKPLPGKSTKGKKKRGPKQRGKRKSGTSFDNDSDSYNPVRKRAQAPEDPITFIEVHDFDQIPNADQTYQPVRKRTSVGASASPDPAIKIELKEDSSQQQIESRKALRKRTPLATSDQFHLEVKEDKEQSSLGEKGGQGALRKLLNEIRQKYF